MIIRIYWSEGTFGYKHLVPYFQIAQHKKKLYVLKAIEEFLLKLFKEEIKINLNKEEFKFIYTAPFFSLIYFIFFNIFFVLTKQKIKIIFFIYKKNN